MVTRGEITYDDYFGHVCTCTAEAGDDEPTAYQNTVHVARDIEPTESGSWWYVCDRCGSGGWSGL